MSEAAPPDDSAPVAAVPEAADPPSGDEPFTPEQRAQFQADDAQAGRLIGRMLCAFFLYTLVVMALTTWWTIRQGQ